MNRLAFNRSCAGVMSGQVTFERSPGESGSVLGEVALNERLLEALRGTGYFIHDPCDVTVQILPGRHVILRGIVPSYYLKQQAQTAVMRVEGVRSLQNDLLVLN